ncbi:MAG: glycine cleavage system protein GcvH [Rhodospirillaceae bacterium]|nr:glycine cleavage system protein GcvH [Rhodospirillaceae bacterium]
MAKKYTSEHEWIEIAGDIGTVGISDYAQEQLGDVVFVELPKVGAAVAQKAQIAVVESVKAASEIYAPVSGTVTEVNASLADEPQLVNQSAEDKGWFFKLKLANPGEIDALMDAEAYAKFAAGGHG